jgi:hypothetical protein
LGLYYNGQEDAIMVLSIEYQRMTKPFNNDIYMLKLLLFFLKTYKFKL